MARAIGLNVEKATEDGIMARVVGHITHLRRKDGEEGYYDREELTYSHDWVLEYIEVFDPEKEVRLEG